MKWNKIIKLQLIEMKYLSQGPQVLTPSQYFARHWTSHDRIQELADSLTSQNLATVSSPDGRKKSKKLFMAHLSPSRAETQIDTGLLLKVWLRKTNKTYILLVLKSTNIALFVLQSLLLHNRYIHMRLMHDAQDIFLGSEVPLHTAPWYVPVFDYDIFAMQDFMIIYLYCIHDLCRLAVKNSKTRLKVPLSCFPFYAVWEHSRFRNGGHDNDLINGIRFMKTLVSKTFQIQVAICVILWF